MMNGNSRGEIKCGLNWHQLGQWLARRLFVFPLVDPGQHLLIRLGTSIRVLNNLTHLGVEEGVFDNNFFLLHVLLEALGLE